MSLFLKLKLLIKCVAVLWITPRRQSSKWFCQKFADFIFASGGGGYVFLSKPKLFIMNFFYNLQLWSSWRLHGIPLIIFRRKLNYNRKIFPSVGWFFSPDIANSEWTCSFFKNPGMLLWTRRIHLWQSRRKISAESPEFFRSKCKKIETFVTVLNLWFSSKNCFLSVQVQCSSDNPAENFSFRIQNLLEQCETKNIAALLCALFSIKSCIQSRLRTILWQKTHSSNSLENFGTIEAMIWVMCQTLGSNWFFNSEIIFSLPILE